MCCWWTRAAHLPPNRAATAAVVDSDPASGGRLALEALGLSGWGAQDQEDTGVHDRPDGPDGVNTHACLLLGAGSPSRAGLPLALLPVASASRRRPIVGETANPSARPSRRTNLWDIASKVARQAGVGRQRSWWPCCVTSGCLHSRGNVTGCQACRWCCPRWASAEGGGSRGIDGAGGAHLAALKSGATLPALPAAWRRSFSRW